MVSRYIKMDYTKFSGINIDKQLTWNHHIANTGCPPPPKKKKKKIPHLVIP